MISFIVPAHNEERLLGHTLASIHTAAGVIRRPYEIVVVDDSSTDRTAEIGRRLGALVVPVQLRHIAATRNAGARVARGDVLIFVDADTVVSGPVLLAALAALDRGAVGGGALFRLDGQIPWHGRLLAFAVRTSMRLGRLAAGCFLFCTREAFDAAGGFDERLFATEEIALSRALGRLGRVAIVRETVETSGRKLRTYSGWEIARLLGALAGIGPRMLRSRDRLDLWYGDRRTDPHTRVPNHTACEP